MMVFDPIIKQVRERTERRRVGSTIQRLEIARILIVRLLLPLCCFLLFRKMKSNTNLLLTEREGRTGEYWPEVVAVRTERSEVRTKRRGPIFPATSFPGPFPWLEKALGTRLYSPVRLELASPVIIKVRKLA